MPLIVAKSVVDGDAESVFTLLKLDYQIPPYQRDYVWQEKQVGQLWDDLVDHFHRFAVSDSLVNPDGYFLGAMVVIEDPTTRLLEVVDGQQRLTTLSTVMAVLFDELQSQPAGDPNRIGYEHTIRDMLGKFDNASWTANLHFSDPDLGRFFLESCLLKRARAEKQEFWDQPWSADRISRKKLPIARLKAAIDVGYIKLKEFLDTQPDPNLRGIRFLSFLRLATEAVVLLKITARSYGSAYAIFESLNNRNVPLSQADLIKNELLKVAAAADRDEVVDNWVNSRQLVESMEPIQLPDAIHYSYLSRHGRAKARDLYQKAKAQVTSPASARAYSIELLEDVEALDALISNFDSSWTADTANMLRDIKDVLKVKLTYPYLIAAYRVNRTLPLEFEKHVRAAMNFAFRYVTVGEGSLEVFANTISEAALIVNAGNSVTDAKKLFSSQSPDAEFAAEFATFSTASVKLGYYCAYYLELVQITGVIPVPHGVDQNLEHIMPKTPSSTNWPTIVTLKAASPEVFRSYLWRVGNLLPLPAAINKSIKNRDINYKINNSTPNHYNAATLGLASPKSVVKYLDGGEWTYTSIENRQKDQATKFAATAWSLT